MIYVLTLVLSSIFAFCYDHASNKKQMTVFFILTLIMPFFVMALRYGVGQDYFYTYVPVFNSVLNNTYSSDLEIGFLWLNKFCLPLFCFVFLFLEHFDIIWKKEYFV